MANDVDKQIRNAIKPLITSGYPNARVYVWNVLSHNLADWPGLFVQDDGMIHGWIIKRAETSSTWKMPTRDRKTAVYDIWGFYEFRSGDEGNNSDDEFADICDTVYENILASHNFGLEGIVERHDLLQFVQISTIDCGERVLHIARGRLTVHMCC